MFVRELIFLLDNFLQVMDVLLIFFIKLAELLAADSQLLMLDVLWGGLMLGDSLGSLAVAELVLLLRLWRLQLFFRLTLQKLIF